MRNTADTLGRKLVSLSYFGLYFLKGIFPLTGLSRFGITGMTGLQKMALLSGGQKSRVAFACLSLTNPHILVLDEPSNHLDIEAMDALSEALRNFQGGVLMVSHDVTMLQNVCTSLWVCDRGRVEKFDGDVNAYKKRITAQADEAGVARPHG
jgi:ATP-binding cassette, subfamily F, member 3